MRAVAFVLWALVVTVLLLPVLRRLVRAPRLRSSAAPDELVKDPVCETYVVRSRAVRRMDADGPRYFCSAECARRYLG